MATVDVGVSCWYDGRVAGSRGGRLAQAAGLPPVPIPTHDPSVAVVFLANYYRQRAGVGPLSIDADLSRSAQAFVLELARRQTLSHYGLDGTDPGMRARKAGYLYANVGEVIAEGYPGYLAVVAGWLGDGPHAQALLDGRYAACGSGCAMSGSGVPFWVLDLARPG